MKTVLPLYIFWSILIFASFFVGQKLLPLQNSYVGGGYVNHISNPSFWARGNFDGEHYMEIAHLGYGPLRYFFFPLYPLLMNLTVNPFEHSIYNYALSGISISMLSSIAGIYLLYKLVLLDEKQKVAKWTIISLLLFPVSFYIQSIYTEALFIMLCVGSFYASRKQKWYLAVVLGIFASATRLAGSFLLLALLFEWYIQYRSEQRTKKHYLYLASIFFVPVGLIMYLVFLYIQTGDALVFYNNIGIFGQQRSSQIILLPQVFYRYIFKIIPATTQYWPMLVTILLEFATGVLFLCLSIYAFFKIRGSYAIFLICCYLLPTISGSFSSLPRYGLHFFPIFIMFGKYLATKGNYAQIAYISICLPLFILFAALFSRGFWVS